MSEAPVKELYRGRADGVRGDEATYLSMSVRHGHSRRASGLPLGRPVPGCSASLNP